MIHFKAVFAKSSTTVDGGWNITFSVSQSDSAQVIKLSDIRNDLLDIFVLPSKNFPSGLPEEISFPGGDPDAA